MTSEVQVFAKDKMKLNILQEILDGTVDISLQQGDEAPQDYASQIHTDGKRVYVFGKFNISEDAVTGDTITIRPIMIDAPFKIMFRANAHFSGKTVSVIRNSTKMVEQAFEISSETVSLELTAQQKQYYLLKVTNGGGIAARPLPDTAPQPRITPAAKPAPTSVVQSAQTQPAVPFEEIGLAEKQPRADGRFEGFDLGANFGGNDKRFEAANVDSAAVLRGAASKPNFEPAEAMPARAQTGAAPFAAQNRGASEMYQDDQDLHRIEQEISVIERQQGELFQKKQSAIAHLNKIETEYQKDYAAFERELEEYKARMEADASVVAHYKDQDVTPIEMVFREIDQKLEEAEAQIRFFIEAKQRRTMEIEQEIKSNKKQ